MLTPFVWPALLRAEWRVVWMLFFACPLARSGSGRVSRALVHQLVDQRPRWLCGHGGTALVGPSCFVHLLLVGGLGLLAGSFARSWSGRVSRALVHQWVSMWLRWLAPFRLAWCAAPAWAFCSWLPVAGLPVVFVVLSDGTALVGPSCAFAPAAGWRFGRAKQPLLPLCLFCMLIRVLP